MSFYQREGKDPPAYALPFHQLLLDEVDLSSGFCLLLQKVWKEEYFQHKEDDNQLDYYHRPQRLAQSHVPETVVVKVEDTVNESLLVHSMK